MCAIKISLEHTAASSKGIVVSAPWRWRDNSAETYRSCIKIL